MIQPVSAGEDYCQDHLTLLLPLQQITTLAAYNSFSSLLQQQRQLRLLEEYGYTLSKLLYLWSR